MLSTSYQVKVSQNGMSSHLWISYYLAKLIICTLSTKVMKFATANYITFVERSDVIIILCKMYSNCSTQYNIFYLHIWWVSRGLLGAESYHFVGWILFKSLISSTMPSLSFSLWLVHKTVWVKNRLTECS